MGETKVNIFKKIFNKKWFLNVLPYLVLVLVAELVLISAWVGPRPAMLKLIVACLIPHILLLICGVIPLFYRWMECVWQFVLKQVKSLRNHQWKKGLLMVLADIVAASVAERILTWIADGSITSGYNFRKAIFAFVVVFIVSLFIMFREEMRTRVEIIVFLVMMSIGSAYVTTLPVSCGVSWDDESHYRYMMYVAHMFNGDINDGEYKMLTEFMATTTERARYTEEEHKEWVTELNEAAESGNYREDGWVWPKLEYWCYVPSAIGYTLGNALHLPYAVNFVLGKWFNLFAYALLIYFAIKRIKTGKMLVAAVAMLPPNIIMATNYGRDAYMIGFIMLGFCYLMGELQEPEKKLTVWDMVIIIGAFVLGVMPKAVYGPILLTALFLPRSKFKSKKQCYIYRACVLGATLLVMASFLLPFLVTKGTDRGDYRGGTGVDGGSQTAFVLANPLRYIEILWNFMKDYLSYYQAQNLLGFMAYFGHAGFNNLLPMLLIAVALTDRESRYDRCIKLPVRVAGVVLSLSTLALAATAMYISFTPVGSDTIGGCQYRYQMQVMVPMLFLTFGIPLDNKMDKYWYRGIVLGIMSFVLLRVLWNNCIATF